MGCIVLVGSGIWIMTPKGTGSETNAESSVVALDAITKEVVELVNMRFANHFGTWPERRRGLSTRASASDT